MLLSHDKTKTMKLCCWIQNQEGLETLLVEMSNMYSSSLPLLSFSEEGKKKKPVRLAIQRSVETGLAVEMKSRMTRQPSRETTDDGEKAKPGK